jgi:thioredoxin 1
MKTQFETLISSPVPVLIDFYAEWCGPCKAQSPVLKEVAQEMGERLKVVKIDVDKNPEIAQKYRIQGVPTLMLFKDGELKFRQAGMMTKPQIMKTLVAHS